MKKLISIFLVLVILSVISVPIFAAESPKKGLELSIGTKIRTDSNTELTYKGKDKSSNYIYEARISSLPEYCSDLTTKIDPTWYYNSNTKLWKSGSNLFKATIDRTNVIITDLDGKKVTINSKIKINNVLIKPISEYPILLSVDPINSNYHSNTMEWNYGTFKRQVRLIEGLISQYLIFESNPNGTVDIGVSFSDNGYIAARENEAWDSAGSPLQIKDNQIIEASEFNRKDIIYPVTIDPTSTFTTSASDGYAISITNPYSHDAAASNMNTSNTEMRLGQNFIFGQYYIFRDFLYFNTSTLNPVVTITAATLYLYGSQDWSATDFDVDLMMGTATVPHDPLELDDFYKGYYELLGSGGSFNTSALTCTSYNTIALNATAISKINKGSYTRFALQSSLDIAGTAPIGYENIYFWTYEKGSGYEPYLSVTFTSADPVITSVAASNIALVTARLNSNLSNDSGDPCTITFGYGTTTQTAVNFNAYDTKTAVSGTWISGQLPYLDVSGLIASTTYYYRVKATNSHTSIVSTSEQSFTTQTAIADVTGLTGIPTNDTIQLNWNSAVGATTYKLKFSNIAFPTALTGTEIYTDTATSYTHTGLTSGTNYYYSVWGVSGASESTNPDEFLITSGIGSTAADGIPDMPTPSGWFQSPNYTNLSGIPVLYDVVNNIADGLGMPYGTMWLIIAILISITLGAVTYIFAGQHIVAALAVLTLCLAIWWSVEIVSMWYPAVTLIITIGMLTIRRQF